MPNTRALDVLVVEGDDAAARRILDLLGPDARIRSRHVATLDAALAETARARPTVALIALDLPDSEGLDTFQRYHDAFPTLPIVVLADADDDGLPRAAIRAGAMDHLDKRELSKGILARTLRVAVERAEHRAEVLAHKHFLDAVGQAVVVIDREGFIQYWNDAATRLYGWSKEEAFGRPVGDLQLSAMTPGERAQVRAGLAAGRPWVGEVTLRKKDGTTFAGYAVNTPTLDAEGNLTGSIGISHDITDLKRLERKARQSAARARSAHRIAGLFSYEIDLVHRTVTWDESAYAQMHLDPATFTPTIENVMDLIEPEDRPRVEAWIRNMSTDPKTLRTEYRIRRADGSILLLEVLAEPRFQNGALIAFTAVGRDITAQRAREEDDERARSVELERERLRGLGTLVAGVAHEINNPLTYMQGSAELSQLTIRELLAEGDLAAPVRERIEEVDSQLDFLLKGIDAIATITRALKQVARAPSGVRTPEDICRLVEDVLSIARSRIPASVDIHKDLPAEAFALVNAGEITQVFLNLLINAGDAIGPRRGNVTVRVKVERGSVVLDVVDDGPGIPPAAAARLFTPFFTTKPEGTGLGLSLSRRIVEDHGGTLGFTSKPGRGTTFRVVLPSAPLPTGHASSPARSS